MTLKGLLRSFVIWFIWHGITCTLAYVTTNPKQTVTIGGQCTCEALFMPKKAFTRLIANQDVYRLPDDHTYNFFVYNRGRKDLQMRPFSVNEDLSSTTFDPSKPTFVFFPGYTESIFLLVFQLIKNEYLKKVDGNVIMVDWYSGNRYSNGYPQTISNSEAAGCQAAILIKNLVQRRRSNIKNFYFSGHSVGSHTAAFAAKKIKGLLNQAIYRISALDPSQVWYVQTTPDHKLRKGDADFIDVIHSGDSKTFLVQISFGDIMPVGDIDFYPDGGRAQNACPEALILINDIQELCSHAAASVYFANSINGPCNYTSCPCPSVPYANSTEKDWKDCLKNCNPANNPMMGYPADQSTAKGPHYLEISRTDPKCTTVFSYLKLNDIIQIFNDIVIGLLKLLKLYDPALEIFKNLQLLIENIISKFTTKLPLMLPISG